MPSVVEPDPTRLLRLLGAGEDLEQAADPASLVRPILEVLSQVSGLETVFLTRIEWEAEVQHVVVSHNVDAGFTIDEGLATPWDETLCQLSLEEGPTWNAEVPATWGRRSAVAELGIQSYVSVPVQLDDEERPYGTLCASSPRRVDPDEDVVRLLRSFAALLAAAVERDELLERAERRAAEAERRLLGRIAFAAQVEHALRTPIQVIGGWTETLLGRVDAGRPLQRQALERIASTAARLGEQVGELLAEARSTIGDGPPEPVVLEEVARALAPLAADHEYEVRGRCTVLADPIALPVLVEHLVENAVRHTPAGTPIRVVLSDDRLVVEDDGPGLPRDRKDLFDPFVTTRATDGGTGLGLHIVSQVADRLGATLEVGSTPAGGARFTVIFGTGEA